MASEPAVGSVRQNAATVSPDAHCGGKRSYLPSDSRVYGILIGSVVVNEGSETAGIN